MGTIRGTSKEKIYQELGFGSLQQRQWYRKLCCLFKILKNTHQVISFFPSIINEWNNLVPNIRNSESVGFFKSNILKIMRPKPNSIYSCHNPKGIILITRLRVGLSHLREHKFKHSFQDCLIPLCLCGNDIETSSHFLLYCPTYSNERMTFLNKI